MSELDKIKECLDFFCRRCNEQGFYSPPLQPIVKEAYEAIAALRSEPVATVRRKEDDSLEFTPLCDFYVVNGMKLYAAPSRETAKVVPVHSKSQYRRVAAQGGNPVLSRETEQRESSGVKGWEFSAGTGSNPAPMHGQSKTGLTGSHPDAPTYQRESAEADNSGGQSLKSGGSGSSGARPPTIANHPDRVATTQTDSRPTAEPALSAEQNTLQAWLDKNYPAEKWSKYQRDLLSVAWNAALDSIKSKPEWGSVEHYDAAWSAFGGDKFADLHKKLSIDHIRRLFTMFAQCADLTARDEELLRGAVDDLRAVLCDPEGNASIHGSVGDLAIVEGALQRIDAYLSRRQG